MDDAQSHIFKENSKKRKTTSIVLSIFVLVTLLFFLPGRGQTKSQRPPLPALFSTSPTPKRVLLKRFTAFKIPFVRSLLKLFLHCESIYPLAVLEQYVLDNYQQRI